jgi:hypothetical protein
MPGSDMIKGKRVGWRHGDDLYTAALILTERPTRITIDITVEPVKPWQPSVRVSERVVRRRKPC